MVTMVNQSSLHEGEIAQPEGNDVICGKGKHDVCDPVYHDKVIF